jgi:hypothetical protein
MTVPIRYTCTPIAYLVVRTVHVILQSCIPYRSDYRPDTLSRGPFFRISAATTAAIILQDLTIILQDLAMISQDLTGILRDPAMIDPLRYCIGKILQDLIAMVFKDLSKILQDLAIILHCISYCRSYKNPRCS